MPTVRTLSLALLLLACVRPARADDAAAQPAPPLKEAVARRIAEQYKDLIPTLIDNLKDPDEQVRAHAANALTNLGDRAVPALIETLNGGDLVLRIQAATLLGSMASHGQRHRAALPALIKAAKDGDPFLRRSATSALSQFLAGESMP